MTSPPLPPVSPFDPDTMIQALDSTGRGLRVVFFKPADRWAHVVCEVQGEESVVPLLVSVEGSPDDAWPASPPLQSLSIENRPAGSVALLVGMAGRSHWSASVEVAEGKLVFDLACRVSGSSCELESTYQLLDDVDRFDITPTRGAVNAQGERLIIRPEPVLPSPSVRWTYTLQLRG